ncbi:MAG: S-layer homology domain-containing protein [bacterium]|nr:S-layer homology domain-containing protein [bacterium]
MKRIISLFTAAAFLAAPLAAGAEKDGLITVSEWAYPSVSAFCDTGLMPESLGEINDYTEPITRGQYCELIYSVVKQSKKITGVTEKQFTDSDSEAVNSLAAVKIVNGIGDGSFGAEQPLTREAAAAIACRAMEYCNDGKIASEIKELYADDEDFSDWSREAIYALKNIGIMNGTDLGFDPAGTYTVEQAVTTMFRVYKKLPSFNPRFYDGVTGSEDGERLYEILTYSNGYKEVQQGDKLGIADSENNILMSFGTDVYRELDCVTRNGITLVFATPHKTGKIYAYKLETKEVLFTLECEKISSLNSEYIVVKSQNTGDGDNDCLYGVYDYSGNIILPIEYSYEAIKEKGYAAGGTTGFVIGTKGSPVVIKGHFSEVKDSLDKQGSAGGSGISAKIDENGEVKDIHKVSSGSSTDTSKNKQTRSSLLIGGGRRQIVQF